MKQSGESVESVRKKKRKATVGRICRKEGFKPRMKEWRGVGWWEWWVDGTNAASATWRTGWVRIREISAWLMERCQELLPETRGSIVEERSVVHREDDVDGRARWRASDARWLNCGEVMQIWRLGGCEDFVGKWKELVFSAFGYLLTCNREDGVWSLKG